MYSLERIGAHVQVNKGNIDVYNLTSNFDQMTFYNDNGLVHADQLSGLRVNLNTSYGEVRVVSRLVLSPRRLSLSPPRCRGGRRNERETDITPLAREPASKTDVA